MKKTLNTLLGWTFGSFNVLAVMLFFMFQNDYKDIDTGSKMACCGGGLVFTLIILIVAVFELIAFWKIFTKAGKPGWAAIIPIYNLYILTEINGRPPVWIIIYWIIGFIMIPIDLAKSFGKETGWIIGAIILPFIFYPMLGFGSAEYKGPGAATTTGTPTV